MPFSATSGWLFASVILASGQHGAGATGIPLLSVRSEHRPVSPAGGVRGNWKEDVMERNDALASASARQPAPGQAVQPDGQLRARIRAYLEEQFKAKGIPSDVTLRVLAKIDLAARGEDWLRLADDGFPPLRKWPSVAQQIRWQGALDEISVWFGRKFPSQYVKTGTDYLEIESDANSSPTPDMLLAVIPRIIANGQGDFSRNIGAWGGWRPGDGPALSRLDLGRWRSPIKVSRTGQKTIDARLALAIGSMSGRASHASARPALADVEDSNVFIGSSQFAGSTVERLVLCLRDERCGSMQAISHGVDRPPAGQRDRTRFIETLYLTNPYASGGPTGLLEISSDGRRIAAYCGHTDMGYRYLAGAKPVQAGLLERCIGYLIK